MFRLGKQQVSGERICSDVPVRGAGYCYDSFVSQQSMRRLIAAVAFVSVPATLLVGHAQSKPAVPVEPITAILDAFKTHQIVALGEGAHGNEQGHAFRLSLIRDRRFAEVVNDLVVEFGNSRYQDVIDRFTGGSDVPYDSLRKAWQDTTQPHDVWDRPIYEEFFRAVRELNRILPEERQLRVLLGDPPVNWDSGEPMLDGKPSMGTLERDPHAADLIRREVLAKNRRALVIYGDNHLFRAGRSLVSLVESTAGVRVFTIGNAQGTRFEDVAGLQPNITLWPIPSLASIRGTVIDAKQLVFYDAVLYLGSPSAITLSGLSPALCADAEYMQMRLKRMALVKGLQRMSDQLKQHCDTMSK
jgi:hypothetical protein